MEKQKKKKKILENKYSVEKRLYDHYRKISLFENKTRWYLLKKILIIVVIILQ